MFSPLGQVLFQIICTNIPLRPFYSAIIMLFPLVDVLCQIVHKDINFKNIIQVSSEGLESLYSVLAECPAIQDHLPGISLLT